MIGFLKGEIYKKIIDDTYILLSGQIGYKVNISGDITVGEYIEIDIYTHYTENEVTLWGFKNSNEYLLFSILITVNGIGPKTAFNYMKSKGIVNIVGGIKNKDFNALKGSGVGDKTSKRIIIDLYDKVSTIKVFQNLVEENNIGSEKFSTILEALVSLGYSTNEVLKYLESLETKDEALNINETIKNFLKKAR